MFKVMAWGGGGKSAISKLMVGGEGHQPCSM